jgi:hypothetical protein
MADDFPRLKTHIRVAALLRRAQAAGAFATVVRRGDPDAGALAVKAFLGPGTARLFVEARDERGARCWREALDGVDDEARIDALLERERAVDPDLWIIEIEDRDGRVVPEALA